MLFAARLSLELPKKRMTAFWKKLAIALGLALAIAAAVRAAGTKSESVKLEPNAPKALSGRPLSAIPPAQQGKPDSARKLIPSSAWLIVDFATALAESAPFAGARDPACAEVQAPARAAVGIVPPRTLDEAPELVLAATNISRRFFECARDQILASGGREAPVNPAIDFLQSPTGILLFERLDPTSGNLIFATGKPELEPLVRALLLDPKHLPLSPHAGLEPLLGETESVARATLVLPDNWLAGAGPDSRKSPLRHAKGGVATLGPTGSARVRLLCEPSGCAELRTFAERALHDLGRKIPGGIGTPVWSEAPGALEFELKGRIAALGPWLGRLGGLLP